MKFNKQKIEELKSAIQNSYAHDARIKSAEYDFCENALKIKAFNAIFNTKIELVAKNVELTFTVEGDFNYPGSNDTIISLTVEADFSYLKNYINNCKKFKEDTIYLLFQMLSGAELHIVAKDIYFKVVRGGGINGNHNGNHYFPGSPVPKL